MPQIGGPQDVRSQDARSGIPRREVIDGFRACRRPTCVTRLLEGAMKHLDALALLVASSVSFDSPCAHLNLAQSPFASRAPPRLLESRETIPKRRDALRRVLVRVR